MMEIRVQTLLDTVLSRLSPEACKIVEEVVPSDPETWLPLLGEYPTGKASQRILLTVLLDNTFSMDEDEVLGVGETKRPRRLYHALCDAVNNGWDQIMDMGQRFNIDILMQLLHPNPTYVELCYSQDNPFVCRALVKGQDEKNVPTLKAKEQLLDGPGTPLYRRSCEIIVLALLRAEALALPPYRISTIHRILSITDGESTEKVENMRSYHGRAFGAKDVAVLVGALPRETVEVHYWGLERRGFDPFPVGRNMGIPDRNVQKPPANAKALRELFGLWSSSAANPKPRQADDVSALTRQERIKLDTVGSDDIKENNPEASVFGKPSGVPPAFDDREKEEKKEEEFNWTAGGFGSTPSTQKDSSFLDSWDDDD